MSVTVTLYSFAKDDNSTAQPTGTGTAFTCNVLTPCDITAPVVELSGTDLTGYNYAYIASFHRYYFIQGITYDKGLWRLALKCDVLATYKTTIGNASLFVIRAASDYDGEIRDEYYPPTADIEYYTQTETPFSGYSYSSGCYVLNVMGTDSNGASTLYQLDVSNFQKLIEELYTDINGFQLADVVKTVVQKFGGNPTQLINGCHWFPTDFTFVTSSTYPIKIGGWTSTTAVGKKITNPIGYLPGFNPTIAAHPQVAKGRYLNLAPYSKYELYIPGIGIINLDTTELMGINKIYVTRHIDAFTGRMSCIVQTDPDNVSDPYHYLAVVEGQWGVPISLSGGSSGNAGSFVGQAIGTVGAITAAALTGGASAIVGAATGGIGSMMAASSGAPSNCSTGGAIVSMEEPMRLDTTFYRITGWDDTHNGRPLMQTKTINTLSGFVMVQKGDVAISGTAAEADEIRTLLEGGFYYE